MATTRQSIRRWAAAELGPYALLTADASGHTTSTVVVTTLATTLTVTDQFSDYGLMIPAAAAAGDRDNRYVSSGPATTGTLTVDRVFSASTVPNSAVVELHGVIKTLAEWDRYVNDGLMQILVPVEFTVTAVANANRHNLTTGQTWLTSELWPRRLGYLSSTETRANVDPYDGRSIRFRAQRDGQTVYLYHPGRTFTSETLYVEAYKPAYFHCRASAGTFGGQSGLALENDECVPTDKFVGCAALLEYARRAPGFLSDGTVPAAAQKLEQWTRMFSYFAQREVPAITSGPPPILSVSIR